MHPTDQTKWVRHHTSTDGIHGNRSAVNERDGQDYTGPVGGTSYQKKK